MSLTAFCKGVAGKSFKVKPVSNELPAAFQIERQIDPNKGGRLLP